MHVLSFSQYGSGLSRVGPRFSGALARQRDYARAVERYSVIVPSETGSEAPIAYGDSLTIHPVPAASPFAFLIRAYGRALALHAAHPIDAVMVDNPHVIGILGALSKRRFRVPLVVHSMSDMIGNVWYLRERLSNRINVLFMRFSLGVADLIRVSTAHEVSRLRAMGIPEDRVARVPFYIDKEEFTRRLDASPAEEDPHMVLYVGRLGPQKDVATLVKAMKVVVRQRPAATLVLAGDGPEKRELQGLVRSLGLEERITFAGRIPHEEVVSCFKRARVFAISSLHEGTCMVLHEAAAAKKPLVATAFAGAVDFIRDGIEGYIVPIRDHVALAEKIALALDDGARVMGRAAFVRLEAFSREEALGAWHALLSRLVQDRSTSSIRPSGAC